MCQCAFTHLANEWQPHTAARDTNRPGADIGNSQRLRFRRWAASAALLLAIDSAQFRFNEALPEPN